MILECLSVSAAQKKTRMRWVLAARMIWRTCLRVNTSGNVLTFLSLSIASAFQSREQVLKYLTRYMTGGPISDARIVGQSQDQVTFVARSKDKSQGHPPVEHTISGVEFVRRWSLHILPKGFTRCRRYGGYHGSRSTWYLETCRDLLGLKEADQEAQEPSPERSPEQSQAVAAADNSPRCPRCQQPMVLLERIPRPSWRDVFHGSVSHPPLVDFPWLRPDPPTRQHPFEPDG